MLADQNRIKAQIVDWVKKILRYEDPMIPPLPYKLEQYSVATWTFTKDLGPISLSGERLFRFDIDKTLLEGALHNKKVQKIAQNPTVYRVSAELRVVMPYKPYSADISASEFEVTT